MKLIKVVCKKADAEVANQPGEYKNFTGNIDWKGSKGIVKDANFLLKNDGKIIFYGGTWINGYWRGGKFEKGKWKEGTWANGTFEGTWEDGVFEDGTFKGVWLDGAWGSKAHYSGKKWVKGYDENGDLQTHQPPWNWMFKRAEENGW